MLSTSLVSSSPSSTTSSFTSSPSFSCYSEDLMATTMLSNSDSFTTNAMQYFSSKAAIEELLRHLLARDAAYACDTRYFARHTELESSNRAHIVEWMRKICGLYAFERVTFQRAVRMLDVALARAAAPVPLAELQLTASIALSLVVKAHEPAILSLEQLQSINDGVYSKAQLKATELRLLEALRWQLAPPTPIDALHCVLQLMAHAAHTRKDARLCNTLYGASATCTHGVKCLAHGAANSGGRRGGGGGGVAAASDLSKPPLFPAALAYYAAQLLDLAAHTDASVGVSPLLLAALAVDALLDGDAKTSELLPQTTRDALAAARRAAASQRAAVDQLARLFDAALATRDVIRPSSSERVRARDAPDTDTLSACLGLKPWRVANIQVAHEDLFGELVTLVGAAAANKHKKMKTK